MLARRVPVNAVSLLLARVVGAFAAVVVMSISAHRLTLDQFGLVASVLAAGFLANSLVTFGSDTVVTRALAAERENAGRLVRSALRLQVGVSILLIVTAFMAVQLGANAVILWQALVLVPMAVVTVTGAVLRGGQRMHLLLVAAAAGSVATLLALVGLFATATEAWVPIASFGVGSVVTAALSTWFARAVLGSAVDQGGSLRHVAAESAPFAAMVVLAAVGAQAGPLLVEFASDDTAGGYGVAVRMTEAARMVPAAAMGAFFPAMLSGLHKTDRYRRWLRWLFGYAAAATVALLAAAGVLNRLVFDGQPDGAQLIRILALGLVLTVLRLARSFELIAAGNERRVLASAAAGTAVFLLGGVLVANRFGPLGIAWSQLAGLATATLMLLSPAVRA